MNNIEELKAAATAMRLSSTMRITDEIITFRRLFTPDCILNLIAQLEAAQGNIKELESKVNHYVAAEYAHKHFDQTPDIIKRADSAELELVKVKAELSAANEKLSKPVVLPPRRIASYFVDEEFSNEDLAAIYNAARLEFSVKVKNAGFTVEGE